METSVLTPEIMKANNPGLTDFGSGNLLALTSQCLRCAKKSTPCTICADFCPTGAIETNATGRPVVAIASCIKCGACVGACPVNALAAATKTLQQIIRLALQASLRVEHLAIGCERTAALLRLEAQTDEPEAAEEELRLIERARASEHLQVIPCLGMLTKELWFAILNEIGPSRLEELSVFLPSGQCAECPVNARDAIEAQLDTAISCAEEWTGLSIGLITETSELPRTRKANVRDYLASDLELDRRGAFTGFLQELRQSWDDNAKVGNQAVEEVRLQRERKKSFERTRLSAKIKKGKPGGRNPIAVPTRYILVEALGRNDAHGEDVSLIVSSTDRQRCTLCGDCVDACPVHARSIVEEPLPTENATTDTAVDTDANAGAGAPGATDTATDTNVGAATDAGTDTNVGTTDNASTGDGGEAPANTHRVVVVDELYCIACSACLQICPTEACTFTEIEGGSFLLDETEIPNATEA